MQIFLQQVVNGLSTGAVYALIALGYTMVYGVLRLINFAHGDVYMVGAVAAYYLAAAAQRHSTSPAVAILIVLAGSMICCGVLGFLIEFLCYRPLRNRPRLVVLITAIGVSLFLENFFQLSWVFGPKNLQMPTLLPEKTIFSFYVHGSSIPVSIHSSDAISMGLSLVLMAALTWVVFATKTGLAMRAVSYRFDTASLMGINTNRVISVTFVLGSCLAAVAGVVDSFRFGVGPLMGVRAGILAFIAAVLGGIGNIPGAVLGGLLIGLLQKLLEGFILPDRYSNFAEPAVFMVLILVLLIRPTGLLGRSQIEKV